MSDPSNINKLSQAVDLWAITRTKAFVWVVILITAMLVIFEARYNIDLLNALSDPGAQGATASDLSQRGKLLAAFGISWAVGRELLSRVRPALVGLLLFFLLATSTYHGLDFIYTKAIAGLKPEVKVMGFNLFSYRHDLLNGTLSDPDIPLPKNEPVIGKIFMGAFPIVILDDRFMLPAQDIIERKAEDKSSALIFAAEKGWSDYSPAMQALSNAHTQFLDISKKALGISNTDKDWAIYNTNMNNLTAAHSKFVDGSRKAMGLSSGDNGWASYNNNMQSLRNGHEKFVAGSIRAAGAWGGTNAFRRQSGGLDPNRNISLLQFVELIKTSSLPEADEIRRSESRVIYKRADGRTIYGRDIPYFMGQQEFNRWFSAQYKEEMKASGFEPNPNLTRQGFVDMLRKSKHPKGEELRKAESRELVKIEDGKSLYGRDVPYFMNHDEFQRWFATQAKKAIQAGGFEPNPDLNRLEFVEMLRKSNHPKGEELRKAESRELGKRPDGTSIYPTDIPYFMGHTEYIEWFKSQAKLAKELAIPTAKNVETFSRIEEVNAAVFLPPMAIISSLTSALTNGISLVIILVATVFSMIKATNKLGLLIKRLTVPLMLLIFATLLYFMPSHVFIKDTPIYELETKLHEEVGFAGVVWSRLSNLQKFVL